MREEETAQKRAIYIKDIIKDGERYRNEFKEMLGWPLVGHSDESVPEAGIEKLSDEAGYTLYRMQIEVIEGLRLTGLFFKNNNDELFEVKHGIESFERIKEIFEDKDTGWIKLVVFDGVHEFCKDDKPIEEFLSVLM